MLWTLFCKISSTKIKKICKFVAAVNIVFYYFTHYCFLFYFEGKGWLRRAEAQDFA